MSVLGAGLAFFGARAGARQQERAGRRTEWRQRFEIALDQLSESADRRRRAIGHAILRSLAKSDFATDEDRALAKAVLARDLEGAGVAGFGLFDVTGMDGKAANSDNESDHEATGGPR